MGTLRVKVRDEQNYLMQLLLLFVTVDLSLYHFPLTNDKIASGSLHELLQYSFNQDLYTAFKFCEQEILL